VHAFLECHNTLLMFLFFLGEKIYVSHSKCWRCSWYQLQIYL